MVWFISTENLKMFENGVNFCLKKVQKVGYFNSQSEIVSDQFVRFRSCLGQSRWKVNDQVFVFIPPPRRSRSQICLYFEDIP